MPSQLTIGPVWEWNPYPAQGGMAMDSLLYTLRQEHTKQLVGDTQLHWSFLTRKYQAATYTPGSLGRFSHPSFGLIRARFCRFKAPNGALWSGAPVGFVQENFAWEVTNAFVSSAPALCAGLQGCFVALADGEYGWVIEDGVNIQSVAVSGAAPTFGSAVGWVGDGTVGVAALSKFGFVMNPGALAGGELPPGSIRVKVP